MQALVLTGATGMTYLRAEASQIDAWAKVGNNLTWSSLLPYYKKSEGFQVPTTAQVEDGASYAATYHGLEGPLTVCVEHHKIAFMRLILIWLMF